jgi:hypothetical protein
MNTKYLAVKWKKLPTRRCSKIWNRCPRQAGINRLNSAIETSFGEVIFLQNQVHQVTITSQTYYSAQ